MKSESNREEKVHTLLTKGISEILPNKNFLISLLDSGKILTVYAGFDPTAPTLHIGHTIQLRKLRHFQDLGHRIIFLVGDFTGRIGDPTDKLAARTQLTEEEIKMNLKLYKKQAGKFIRFTGENAAQIKFNNKWLSKLQFADVLSLASHMTVDQMLKRDMFARRIEEEKPIYIHEFMYPLMQGYDSVAMDVDGEIGGNDQLFNMMTGRTLLKQIKNKEKFVITLKLLEDSTGKKMGKSEGNMVSLLDTPREMYAKIMSWTDGLILPGFELCTDVSDHELQEIKKELETGTNPRNFKMKLAFEVTKTCFTSAKATQAQQAFIHTFQKKEIPDPTKEIRSDNKTLETIFLEEQIAASKGEVRRLAEANAIHLLESEETMSPEGVKEIARAGTYRIGKSRFIRITD